MDMNICRLVASQDIDCTLLMGLILRAHPDDEPATLKLMLQMIAVVFADNTGQQTADQPCRSASCRHSQQDGPK